MLHKLSSSYKEIARHLPELNGKISSSDHKKQLLLEMAGRGELKPKIGHHLYSSLLGYTRKKSQVFDPVFANEIKKLAPQWFVKQSDIVRNKKETILKMAKDGDAKPKRGPILSALLLYTREDSNCYDPIFSTKIRSLRPEWFESSSARNKKQILEMAGKGELKLKIGHRLLRAFFRYTSNKYQTFDPAFTKEIKRIRPDWLVRLAEGVDKKKKTLLDMAKKGEQRPGMKHPLNSALRSYTSKKSFAYDLVFDHKVRKIAPQWFWSPFEANALKKRLLLEIAKKDEARPSRKDRSNQHPLARALMSFTSIKSHVYDPKFTKEIKTLRPDWFYSEIVKQNKDTLLSMAKSKRKRPSLGIKLSRSLGAYTSKNSISYDPIFAKQIRKLAPHWFSNQTQTVNRKKKILLSMAKRGESKPKINHPLYRRLSDYIRKSSSSYDPAFVKHIRNFAPQWLLLKSEITIQKKRTLFGMAKRREAKPKVYETIGLAFREYTRKKSSIYDPVFTAKIKKLAPHWFKKFSKK